ncbi:MAG TPA: hypothetical protein VLA49_11455 [Anaerolineales bacterium]|nr:hypothetical protein [Anaerolineales bacterium]
MKPLAAFSLLLFFIIAFTAPAHADIAPPAPPPGANLGPGDESTQVRMMAETVLIEVLQARTSSEDGKARVTADFSMLNLGNDAEKLAVRFPISANDGFYNYPEITDLQVRVNGVKVATRRITIPDPDDNNYPLPWAEFGVTFPPGQEVSIQLIYTLNGIREYPYVNFEYILETGAGWRGTIGSADLIVRLPYEANPYNVLIDTGWGMSPTSSGATIIGREIYWHYEDLEPTRGHNLSVALLMTSAWNEVLTEQANVSRDPQDGEAWGRLGRIYKITSRLRRGLREDEGGLEVFGLSIAAYEKATALLPNDALWHAGFAELLFDGYYWPEYNSSEKPGLLRALHELARAYQLDPSEPFTLDLIDEVQSALPGGLSQEGGIPVFLWLTATPTSLPSPTPTASPTAHPTLTPEPSATSLPATPTSSATSIPVERTPSPQPAETDAQPAANPPLSLCGAAFLIPLVLMLKRWLSWNRPGSNAL